MGQDAGGLGEAATHAACRQGPEWGSVARAEGTINMYFMVVALAVSRLSGWLNADASCRVKRRAYDAGRGAEREARGRCGGGGASRVQEKGQSSKFIQGWDAGNWRSARRTCCAWM